ncbi:hypothetical protein NDU88_011092 [Pleurodeles waltl]|uniref:Sodefrin-like factor n=1 Tax=Pleurodeles waltl TaxID=8319 RepID=A0AAV7PZS9_PLEWA|nr:hypothetical protein NDU88_011092 [Pleurodeles waltl]
MKTFITCLSFLYALMTAGCALQCEVCFSRESRHCSGDIKTCDEGTMDCQTVITEMIFHGQDPIYNIFKNCSTKEGGHKSNAYQSRGQNFTYQLVQHFCSSNECNRNDSAIEIPVQDNTENGRCCNAGLDLNATSCQPSGTVKCTGKLTNCIYFGGIVQFSLNPMAMAYHACVTIKSTKDLPDFPTRAMLRIDHLEFTKAFKCPQQ